MNILGFMNRLPDEASCVAHLKEQSEQSGAVCKHCGCTEHRRDANKMHKSDYQYCISEEDRGRISVQPHRTKKGNWKRIHKKENSNFALSFLKIEYKNFK